MTDSLWTPDDVAQYLGVPLATVYAWKNKRTGPPAIKVGRYLRFRRTDVDAWLEAGATLGDRVDDWDPTPLATSRQEDVLNLLRSADEAPTASQVAASLQIPRTGAYMTLGQLERRGLVRAHQKDGKKAVLYSAVVSPL